MSQVRSFKSQDAERQFYQHLARYEASEASAGRPAPWAAPLVHLKRWAMLRWLSKRFLVSERSSPR